MEGGGAVGGLGDDAGAVVRGGLVAGGGVCAVGGGGSDGAGGDALDGDGLGVGLLGADGGGDGSLRSCEQRQHEEGERELHGGGGRIEDEGGFGLGVWFDF